MEYIYRERVFGIYLKESVCVCDGERECVCVCMCVHACVCMRYRDRQRVCVCVCVWYLCNLHCTKEIGTQLNLNIYTWFVKCPCVNGMSPRQIPLLISVYLANTMQPSEC